MLARVLDSNFPDRLASFITWIGAAFIVGAILANVV